MKVKIVKSKDLGVRCWSVLRFVGQCYKCERYKQCDYPEKVEKRRYEEPKPGEWKEG